MKLFLNAGFGNPIGDEDLSLIENLGFSGIRQDIPEGAGEGFITILVREFVGRGLTPLFLISSKTGDTAEIVRRAQSLLAVCEQNHAVCNIEVVNEPDINFPYSTSAQLWATTIKAVWNVVHPWGRVITGGISATSKNGLNYLRSVIGEIPASCTIGVHTYRSTSPDKPLEGFSTRHQEFDELKAIVGTRPIWGTEVGWSDGPRGKWWELCVKPLSQDEVFRRLRREFELCSLEGFQVATLFQLNDGKGRDEHFGIRDIGGKLKAAAGVAAGGY